MTIEPNSGNRYFTGVPCKQGHMSDRLISNRACIECLRLRKLNWAANNSNILNTRAKFRRKENPEKFKNYDKVRYKNDPRSKMLSAAKQRAKIKGLKFDIDLEDIQIPSNCPLLDIPLILTDKTISDSSPTLDRIKNSRGYVKGNVIVISYAANRCKGNLNADMILKLANNLKIIENTMPEWLALEKGFI